ncbi:MAG TPA: prepilin peptidase [Terracidiphilus sp.]|nr:prepilin peptidase [Terracidiphilus sp.]
MIRLLITGFAALLGLVFGSFLNVCLTRWPEDESVVRPRSHCRKCNRTLAWWENIPLASWLALRGHCRSCKTWIGWRYPLVELAVGGLWAIEVWITLAGGPSSFENPAIWVLAISRIVFVWLVVALAVLDAENLWLPNWLTWPGILMGFASNLCSLWLNSAPVLAHFGASALRGRLLRTMALRWLLGMAVAAGIVLVIRWTYWLFRKQEGMGLGDAKLMAMLAAWLGLPGALLSFALGVVLSAAFAVVLLAQPSAWRGAKRWTNVPLPFGTFLCVGGVVSSLWGPQLIAAYLRWSGIT